MAIASIDEQLDQSLASIWWNHFLDSTGIDSYNLWVFGTTILVAVVYWTLAGIYTIIDLTSRPRWLLKYKIQQNVPVDTAKLWKAVKQVLVNQFIVTPLCLLLFIDLKFRLLPSVSMRDVPSLATFVKHFIVMIIVEEIVFYYSHRLLHHRSIYKQVHKQHHEWTSPIAAVTFYCHPIEHIVSNLGPISLAGLILNYHITVMWAFTIAAIINSMNDHAGFSFPKPFTKESIVLHDFHHAQFKYNYGVFGLLDRFHGTYREYKVPLKEDAKGKESKTKEIQKNYVLIKN